MLGHYTQQEGRITCVSTTVLAIKEASNAANIANVEILTD